MKKNYCSHCGSLITEKDSYYSAESGDTILCLECGEEQIVFSEDIQTFVHASQAQDVYLDDRISDLDIYNLIVPEED
jgi:RNase P subunit RPR2